MKAGSGDSRSDWINLPSNPVAPLRCAPGFHLHFTILEKMGY